MAHPFTLIACWTATVVIFFLIKYSPHHTQKRSFTLADKSSEEFHATKLVDDIANDTSWIFF